MTSALTPKYVSANVVALDGPTPFISGAHLNVHSLAGTTLYSAEQASRTTTNYQKFVGDGLKKAFVVTAFTPVTAASSVAAADQLKTVATINGSPKIRVRNDAAVGAATNFATAVGGGTAIGEADLTLKNSTAYAVGATALDIKEASGTHTIVLGDQITVAGDSTAYTCVGATYTLDGTGVAVSISPPLKVAIASGDSNTTAVTVAAPVNGVVIFYTAPALNDSVEVFLHTAAEITTVTGGAMTAGRVYNEKLGSFLHAAGNVTVFG